MKEDEIGVIHNFPHAQYVHFCQIMISAKISREKMEFT